MHESFFRTLCFAVLFVLCHCGTESSELGGSEAGNPPQPMTRQLSGSVAESASPDVTERRKAVATEHCVADQIVAIPFDADGATLTEDIADDCSFVIELEVGLVYAIRFDLAGEEVAVLTWETGNNALRANSLYVSEGKSAIAVGRVSLGGGRATPESSPLVSTDADGDGTSDFADADDTNDGTADEDEEDCDLDGLPDVVEGIFDCTDDDDSADDSTEDDGVDDAATDDDEEDGDTTLEPATILEVLPRNRAGLTSGILAADLDDDVVLRADCVLDPESVTSATVTVTDALGLAVACEFELDADGDTLTCTHATLFTPLMTYEASAEGLLCLDARTVTSVTWSWLTLSSLL